MKLCPKGFSISERDSEDYLLVPCFLSSEISLSSSSYIFVSFSFPFFLFVFIECKLRKIELELWNHVQKLFKSLNDTGEIMARAVLFIFRNFALFHCF